MCGLPVFPQERRHPPAAPPAASTASPQTAGEQKAPAPPPVEKLSTTKHTVQIDGKPVNYTATAGTMVLRKEDGTAIASMFFVAYLRDGVTDIARRPITFAYNGGPGSSAVWLQMGALGPMRVLMNAQGQALPPPYKLVDNEFSILDLTDLVFIDPVGTGYSRAAPGQDPKQFYGITGDTESMGNFIREYCTRYARWASPKFLAGESYGTTRSAALSGYLQQHVGMNLNGIVLVSSILNFETVAFHSGNDLPYILYLPTYAAAAWYHKKLPKDLQANREKAIEEARQFAATDYTLALMKGSSLAPAERSRIAQKLARYTGLSPEYIERSNLRVSNQHFMKELLLKDDLIIGRYDSRITGIDQDAVSSTPEYDPSYTVVQGPFTAVWNQYVRTELKFETDLTYEILTGNVQPWSYAQYQNRYVNVADTLSQAMSQNPALKVFVANGYYDLATPFFATQYTFDHMGLAPSVRGNLSMDYFDAGHMMYTQLASLEKLKRDLAQFIASAVPK